MHVLAVYQRAFENTLLRAHSLGREAMMHAHVQMVICGCVSLEAYKYITQDILELFSLAMVIILRRP